MYADFCIAADKKEIYMTNSIRSNKYVRFFYKYIKITAACFVFAAAVSLILEPNELATGGVTGISIILNRVSGIPTGTWFMIINIPIILLGIWKFGVKFIVSTIYSTALVSIFTNLLADYSPLTGDPLLAALAGGSLGAAALGIVFKSGSTTGGTDIIVKVLRARFPQLKTSVLVLIMDVAIVSLSALVFKNVDRALYSGLAVIIMSFVMDKVLYGTDGAKLIFIISDMSGQIAEKLLNEVQIGVTYIEGKGAYSGKEKQVIMCVIKKQLFPKAEEVIKEVDGEAFMIVSSASEIYGEGYKNIFSEKI
jgi:uncharacterized membrane-anchored protein YitT (DUF2179 family)